MAQRNPMNERYRGEGPAGKTRRSASSAKPKRPAGAPTGGAAPAKLSAREQANRRRLAAAEERRADAAARREVAGIVPTDPAYKRWRTIWWALIAVGLVTVAASWLLRTELERNAVLGWALLVSSYAAIGGALAIDFFKIRPLRTAAQKAALADRARESKKR